MAYQHKPNEMSLFKNKHKTDSSHPSMTGSGKISASELGIGDGEIEVEVVAWTNTLKDSGEKWLKVKVKIKEERASTSFSAGGADDDEDLPF